MRLGFIGCGTIAAAIVTGLHSAGYDEPIIVSPRNAEIAAALHRRFDNVTVASSNQSVLDHCDLAVLAVRPQVAADILAALRFRPDHQVISLIAATSLDYLRAATAPAAHVVRAVPLPMVARRQGPTGIYPPNDKVKALFDRLGSAIEIDDERAFDSFTAATAIMASYFRFCDAACAWVADQGVATAQADRFIRQMALGLADTAMTSPDRTLRELADEHQTRGGLNEQVRAYLEDRGLFTALTQALDGVQARLAAAHAANRNSQDDGA